VHDVKVLDRSKIAAQHMKKALIRTKDTAQNLMDDGQVTPEEYASDQVKYAAEDAADTAGNTVKSGAKKAKEKAKDAIQEHRQEKRKLQERMEQEPDTTHRDPAQRQSGAASNSEHRATETARSPQESGRQNVKTKFRDEKRKRPLRRERTVRTAEQQKQTLKQSARSAGKQTLKTKDAMRQTVKTAEKTGRQIKTAAKTTEKGIKTAEKSAQAAKKAAVESMKATQKFAEMALQAAIATAKAVKAAAVATAKAIKSIIAATKELVAAIAAGGGVAAVIIVIILMIALVIGSVFAIFFSGEDTGTGMTMRDAVRQINSDYQGEIRDIKESNAHDDLVMTGVRANWREVLSVYAVKVNTDPDNPQEVASMDAYKLLALSSIFWEMNEIDYHTESYTETVTETSVDEEGNPVETETTVTHTRLYITVTHKTAEEMADEYGFSAEQREQLAELLSDENASLWSSALYGINFSGDIVEVALSQVGNSGDTYWSYMGFESRVEWCACFVSWCANECGYIDADVIPKTAGCVSGESWFRARDQWQDSSYTPNPGDIIYFDWDKVETNGQDGITDHVGIVEKVEGGYIYTIEGNSGDRVSNNAWAVGHYEIYGYGVPIY
jgi:hypothetical protein